MVTYTLTYTDNNNQTQTKTITKDEAVLAETVSDELISELGYRPISIDCNIEESA